MGVHDRDRLSKIAAGQENMNDSRSEREQKHFDLLATETKGVWWGSVTRAGQLRLDERASLAIRYARLREGVTVLEPGAGNAEFTKRIAVSGARIIGVEIAPKQVELAKQYLRNFPQATVVVGDISRLDFPDAAFDAVVGNSVLHHFDLNIALPEIRRVLKPGGVFFFTDPNMLNPQIAMEKNIPWIGRALQNSPDETAFFRWGVKRRLKRCGFKNVWVKPFDFLHPATPQGWISFAQKTSHLLATIPFIREIGGSLQIYAEG